MTSFSGWSSVCSRGYDEVSSLGQTCCVEVSSLGQTHYDEVSSLGQTRCDEVSSLGQTHCDEVSSLGHTRCHSTCHIFPSGIIDKKNKNENIHSFILSVKFLQHVLRVQQVLRNAWYARRHTSSMERILLQPINHGLSKNWECYHRPTLDCSFQ